MPPMTPLTEWIEIGALHDIPRRGARQLETRLGPVAVFRTGEDEIFALIDRCPHKGGPLSEGIVSGRRVTCPLHNWVIELETGCAVAPDEGCSGFLPLRQENGRIWLGLTLEGLGEPPIDG